jgi:D-xylose transport system substrate-binding protein
MKKILSAVAMGVMLVCAGGNAMADAKNPKIGFSIDDLRLERWARDRDYFIAAAEQQGAKVYVQSADASEQRQIAQIENLISRGVDVLVIVPYNATVLTNAVREAKKAKIKVVSYDRLILNADIDAYISFDNNMVGQLQAQGVLAVKPKGNFYLLGGAPTDSNAKMLRDGQLKVLQPLIDKGDIKVVGKQWVKDWSPSEAMSIVENALTANGNKIDTNLKLAGRGGADPRRHRRRRDPGAGFAKAGRQGGGVGPGLRPGRRQARDRRHADADRLQAAEADRHRGRQAVGAAGAQREARL